MQFNDFKMGLDSPVPEQLCASCFFGLDSPVFAELCATCFFGLDSPVFADTCFGQLGLESLVQC